MDTKKVAPEYFWADDITFKEASEAARRYNAYPELIEALQMYVDHSEHVGNLHLSPYVNAKRLLNSLNEVK